jgi:hypothetical protein
VYLLGGWKTKAEEFYPQITQMDADLKTEDRDSEEVPSARREGIRRQTKP